MSASSVFDRFPWPQISDGSIRCAEPPTFHEPREKGAPVCNRIHVSIAPNAGYKPALRSARIGRKIRDQSLVISAVTVAMMDAFDVPHAHPITGLFEKDL